MYTLESNRVRVNIEDRVREANQQRLAHEFHRGKQPSTTPTAVGEPDAEAVSGASSTPATPTGVGARRSAGPSAGDIARVTR